MKVCKNRYKVSAMTLISNSVQYMTVNNCHICCSKCPIGYSLSCRDVICAVLLYARWRYWWHIIRSKPHRYGCKFVAGHRLAVKDAQRSRGLWKSYPWRCSYTMSCLTLRILYMPTRG